MSFDKILVFLVILLGSILQVVAYKHYVSDNGVVYMTAILYCMQIALCIKYILDGKFSFHSLLIILIMAGIIGEYFDFNHWHGVAVLKCIWAFAYIIIGALLFRKAFNHKKSLNFIDSLTLPILSLILWFQAISFIIDIIPIDNLLQYRKYTFAIQLMANTLNYAIIAVVLTILSNNRYRLLLLSGEIRILTLITLIATLPIIENFFLVFFSSF